MWGKYIESEIEKVRENDKSKDGKGLDRKIENKLRAILHPPEERPDGEPAPAPKGKFRDPMQFMGNAGKQVKKR